MLLEYFTDFSFLKAIEIIGLLTGIAYVIGAILEKKWCWYFGIIAVMAYGVSTYYYRLYGEFALQFYYLAISFYGLNQWSKSSKDELSLNDNIDDEVSISYSSSKFLLSNLFIGLLISVILYFGLLYLNSSFPIWDALTSGFAIVATYMTTKKKIENWLIWIVVDAILCYILYLKGMPFYSILYLAYLGFALIGFFKWKKELA